MQVVASVKDVRRISTPVHGAKNSVALQRLDGKALRGDFIAYSTRPMSGQKQQQAVSNICLDMFGCLPFKEPLGRSKRNSGA